MARKPRVSKTEESKSDIITALEFVCLNQRDEGTPNQTHCIIQNKQIITYDGIVSLGYPIESDLAACPQSRRLLAALQRVAGAYSLTQQDAQTLVLQAGRLRVAIPCLELETAASDAPDAIAGLLPDDWRAGLSIVGELAAETASKVEFASVYIQPGSMLATDGIVAIEYWHGLNMPEMVVPKTFINILQKIKLQIVGFGFSDNSLTLHFENNAWIKTRLYLDKWPKDQLNRILSRQMEVHQLPFEFEKALDAVMPFTDGIVHIRNNKISTHIQQEIGASYDLEINQNGVFDPKKLKLALPYIKQINFCTGNGGVALFYGERIRGVICQKVMT